jgi:hypothetical protein
MATKKTTKVEDFMTNRWRPMMAISYMITCLFDFVAAPILWSIVQAIANGGVVANQWNPITLQGAGLYHVAMGAILGVAAWTRGQEKVAALQKDSYVKEKKTDDEVG